MNTIEKLMFWVGNALLLAYAIMIAYGIIASI